MGCGPSSPAPSPCASQRTLSEPPCVCVTQASVSTPTPSANRLEESRTAHDSLRNMRDAPPPPPSPPQLVGSPSAPSSPTHNAHISPPSSPTAHESKYRQRLMASLSAGDLSLIAMRDLSTPSEGFGGGPPPHPTQQEDSKSSTGANTPMVLSSHPSDRRRGIKRTSCETSQRRPRQFRSVLDEEPASPLGGGEFPQHAQSTDGGSVTNPSSPVTRTTPADDSVNQSQPDGPHSPFYTGSSNNAHQRAPRGWEKVNLPRKGSTGMSLDSSILGSSMRSNHIRNRAPIAMNSRALPSVGGSPHSTSILSSVLTYHLLDPPHPEVVPPQWNQQLLGSGVGQQAPPVMGRVPLGMMSSSSSSEESMLLSDQELHIQAQEVFSPHCSVPPDLILQPSDSADAPSVHHPGSASEAFSSPENSRGATHATVSLLEFPPCVVTHSGPHSATVSPGLPPIHHASRSHQPLRAELLPPSEYGAGGKRTSVSSGRTVNNHSVALTDVSLGRGGWGMSSSTTSVVMGKDPQSITVQTSI